MTSIPKLCRCCGKPIPKGTTRVTFEPVKMQYHRNSHGWVYAYFGDEKRPQTVAEAQRYVNSGRIVSVKRNETGIRSVGVWDGESYASPYFCKKECAVDFAYMLAKAGHQSEAHARAAAKRAA